MKWALSQGYNYIKEEVNVPANLGIFYKNKLPQMQ